MSDSVHPRLYTIQDVPGKGKGLIASKKISKGSRILEEEPIISLSNVGFSMKQLQRDLEQQVSSLSKHQREDFLSLHNIHPYRDDAEQYVGSWRTNCLPTENDGGAIFLEACRINHACDNNAQKSWNENIKRYTVHAMKDIGMGEEITITYLYPLKIRATRQNVL